VPDALESQNNPYLGGNSVTKFVISVDISGNSATETIEASLNLQLNRITKKEVGDEGFEIDVDGPTHGLVFKQVVNSNKDVNINRETGPFDIGYSTTWRNSSKYASLQLEVSNPTNEAMSFDWRENFRQAGRDDGYFRTKTIQPGQKIVIDVSNSTTVPTSAYSVGCVLRWNYAERNLENVQIRNIKPLQAIVMTNLQPPKK
jgi:hypothetical protein